LGKYNIEKLKVLFFAHSSPKESSFNIAFSGTALTDSNIPTERYIKTGLFWATVHVFAM
jgi:hypothetical protein